MIKKALIVILLFFVTRVTYSAIDVPNFSFVGKEIANFSVKPTFTNIKIKFKGVSKFSSYIQNIKVKINEPIKEEYKSDEPGSIYSSKFGTGLSAIFVGEKAYRNFLVKKYLEKDYISVLENYKKYYEKIKTKEIKDEVRLIYAFSLFEAGFKKDAYNELDEIIKSQNIFKNVAIDFYFNILKDVNKQKIISIFNELDKKTPFSVYVYLNTLFSSRQYGKVVQYVLDKNVDYDFANDFYIISLYFLGKYDEILKTEYYSETVAPFLVDVLIEKEQVEKVNEILNNLQDGYIKEFFKVKIAALNGTFSPSSLQSLKDIDKLSVLMFYLSRYFPDVDSKAIDEIYFSDYKLNDYKNFYLGLYYYIKNSYKKAILYFDKIIFNDKLYKESLFYKGICYVYIDLNQAESFLTQYLNKSLDDQKIDIARFVVAQIRILHNNYNDAFLLVADCDSNLCKRIKAEVFYHLKKYNNLLKLTEGIKDDRVYFLRAASFYNLKEYSKALDEVEKIKFKERDVDFLRMLIYFKKDKIMKAKAVLNNHLSDIDFLKEGVKYLFLAGKYDDVINYVDKSSINNDYLLLLKAKSLYSLKRYKSAEQIFNALLDKGVYLFDTIYGIINIKKSLGEKNFVNSIVNLISKYDFKDKDFIILQLAKISFENNEKENYIKLINYFFKKYPNSKYASEMLILRANFYMRNNMYEKCVIDADVAYKKSKSAEALFVKAQCLKELDPKKAYFIFKDLLVNKEGYEYLSRKEIIALSDNSSEILENALYFKDKDFNIYYKGLEKFLQKKETIGDESYQYIMELLESGDKNFIPAGLFYKGVYLFNKGDFLYALKHFMKIYYLFKESVYTDRALKYARDCYLKMDKKVEAEKIEKILKKLEG